eukprot:5715242-Alexandrium_andersonii.AAC.1
MLAGSRRNDGKELLEAIDVHRQLGIALVAVWLASFAPIAKDSADCGVEDCGVEDCGVEDCG